MCICPKPEIPATLKYNKCRKNSTKHRHRDLLTSSREDQMDGKVQSPIRQQPSKAESDKPAMPVALLPFSEYIQ